MSFVVDIARSNQPETGRDIDAQKKFIDEFYKSLEKHGEKNEENEKELSSQVRRGDKGAWQFENLGGAWPRCFLSTNFFLQEDSADGGDDGSTPWTTQWKRSQVKRIIEVLLSFGISPIQVRKLPYINNKLGNDISEVLATCPFLVSLHLPDENKKLVHGDHMAPSAWVLYEEVIMASRKRQVFRFRHEKVGPKGSFGDVFADWKFKDDIEHCIPDFEEQLQTLLNGSEWAKVLAECGESMESTSDELARANAELTKKYLEND